MAETFPSFNVDLNAVRRAVAPLSTVCFEAAGGGSTTVGLKIGSATLVDVGQNSAGQKVGLWLSAAHCLDVGSQWALLSFCDFDGAAPRLAVAPVVEREDSTDLVALVASFPSERDVCEPLRLAAGPVVAGERYYRAGWGASIKGDTFSVAAGRAVSVDKRATPPAFSRDDAFRARMIDCFGFDGPIRPGDSGGAVLDAPTGELVGLALGSFGERLRRSDLSATCGVFIALTGRGFVAQSIADFRRKFGGSAVAQL